MSAKPSSTKIGWWICLVCSLIGCRSAKLSAQENIDQHRSRVQQMTVSEKESLRIKRRRFQQLTARQKTELRQLHTEVDQRPELRKTMKAYFEWLTTLSASEIAELKRLEPPQRVKLIKQLRAEQQSKLAGQLAKKKLSPADGRTIVDWVREFILQHQDHILAELPATARERIMSESDPRARLQMLLLAARSEHVVSPLTEDSIRNLLESLSSEARRQIESIQNIEDQRRVLRNWLDSALKIQMRRGGENFLQRAHPQAIQRFYRQQLKPEERGEIDRMPPAAARATLHRRFFEHQTRRRGPGSRERGARGE